MNKKCLAQHLWDNCVFDNTSYMSRNKELRSRDLVGECSRARLFWRYVQNPDAVVFFGKIFGGFALILKTPKALSGYRITTQYGSLKFMFMEPQAVYQDRKLVDVQYEDPKMEEYLKDYLSKRGDKLFSVRVVEIDQGLDTHYAEGGVIGLDGNAVISRAFRMAPDNWKKEYVIKTKDIYRSKSGRLHVGALQHGNWIPSGWFLETDHTITATSLIGKSISQAIDMGYHVCMCENDILTQEKRDAVKLKYDSHFKVLAYPDNEYREEFEEACRDAGIQQALTAMRR